MAKDCSFVMTSDPNIEHSKPGQNESVGHEKQVLNIGAKRF
jgi:hypothetical protein